MPMAIAILEDNAERRDVMSACLRDRFPQYRHCVFTSADGIIRFLEEELANTVAICLDHDLDLIEGANGRCIDPGTGRDVADFLAARTPVCPVVVHTTNAVAAVGMESALTDAGWVIRRVVPYGDLDWIGETWLRAVRDAIVAAAVPMRPTAAVGHPRGV
jgi:hypothetical protein